MFDKQVVKNELEEIYNSSPNKEDYDWDLIVDAYQVVDGFYVFRVDNDAYLFINNELVDCCPGYYKIN